MTRLPEGYTFTVRGFVWEIRRRVGKIALVIQRSKDGELIAYNVMIIQHNRESRIGHQIIREGECLPGWNTFGRLAWNYGRDSLRASNEFRKMWHGV